MATVAKRGKKFSAVYKDRNGKQCWKAIGTNKTEALRIAQELETKEKQIMLGLIDPAAEAHRTERLKPVDTHIASYRAHLEANHRALNYINCTIQDIQRCFEFCKCDNAASLTLPMVDRWRNHCTKTGYPKHPTHPPTPDSRKTINRRIASLKSFFHFLRSIGACQNLILQDYKMLNVKGHETFNRRALTTDEAQRLIAATKDDNRRNIYLFALLTGFRKSEIAAMTPSHFDFENRIIRIQANEAKNKRENQSVVMHAYLADVLQKLCKGKESDEKIFQVPNRTYICGLLQKDLIAAGIDTKDVHFHSLRHTFATLLASAGVGGNTLMAMGRWKDVKTVARYVHPSRDDQRKAIAGLLPMGS